MWYNSAMNFDMISTNPWNSMNLHMNQMWDHSMAMTNLYAVPRYDFSNFYQYNSPYMVQTNPMFTIAQMNWGTPNWANMANTFGWNGTNFGGGAGSSSSTSNNDPEQEAYKLKYNKLRNFIMQLKDCEELTCDEQSILDVACRNTKGTYEERYDALKEAYKEVKETLGDDIIKEFIINNNKLGITVDKNGKTKGDSFYQALTEAGFEYKDTEVDNFVEEFYSDLSEMKDNDSLTEIAEGHVARITTGQVDILDFLSSWNSNFKNGDSRRIIDHYSKQIGKIKKDDDLKETPYSRILRPLVKELISKSEKVDNYLDSASFKKMEEARKELEKALDSSKTHVSGNLATAFDKLYILTRKAATAEVANVVAKNYKEVDSDLFNEKVFNDELNKDLEEEGFKDNDLAGTDVNLSERKRNRVSLTNRDSDKTSKKYDSGKKGGASGSGKIDDDDPEDDSTTTPQTAKKITDYYNSEDKKDTKTDWNKGENLAELLGGITTTGDQNKVTKIIEEDMNASNVFTILAGYEDNDAYINNILKQLNTENSFASKDECIQKILEYAKENLEAQRDVEIAKGSDKNTNKIDRLNKHIGKLETWIGAELSNEDIKDADELLEYYYTNVEDKVDSGGFCDFWGSLWNGTLGTIF